MPARLPNRFEAPERRSIARWRGMKQSIQLALLSSANLGITFLFQWYVLVQLGAGVESDALFAGMTVPQLVLAVVSGSLMHVLVPMLAGEDEERLRHDAWALLVLIGVLFGLLAVVLHATASSWVPLTVPGFDDAGKRLTIELTRIQLIGMVFSAVNGVQWAAYHARQRFIWAEFSPLLSGVLAFVALMWALPRFGVTAAAWLLSLRIVLQALLLLPGMGRVVRPNLHGSAIRQTWQRLKPLLLGTAYYKTDLIVDRFLLSTAGSGSLSLYYLAQQIYGAMSQIINKAIVAPLVPVLSTLHKQRNSEAFRSIYRRQLFRIAIAGCLGVLLFAVLGRQILSLLVEYRSISGQDIDLLWRLMLLMSGQFIIGNIGMIMTSMFYAVGDTRSPTRVGIYAYTFGTFFKIALFYWMGSLGLALGVSIYFLISLLLMQKKITEKRYV